MKIKIFDSYNWESLIEKVNKFLKKFGTTHTKNVLQISYSTSYSGGMRVVRSVLILYKPIK